MDTLADRRKRAEDLQRFDEQHPDAKRPEHQERLAEYLETAQAEDATPRRRGRPSRNIGDTYRQVSIYLPPEVMDQLDRVVDQEQQQLRRTIARTDIIREALELYLKNRLGVPSASPAPTPNIEQHFRRVVSTADAAVTSQTPPVDVPPFDEQTFYLRPLCERKHEYANSGMTLYHRKRQRCLDCDREKKRESHAQKKTASLS